MNLRSNHRYPPRSTGGPGRILVLALAVVLLATMLAPLAGSPAPTVAAQDAPAATEEADPAAQDGRGEGGGEDIPEETPETPIVEETPVIEQTPVVEETPDPALDPAQEDPKTSGIFVAMKACPSLYGGDIQQLSNNCQPADDIPFDVYGGGVLQESAEGTFNVDGLPAGQYTIRQYLPPGYSSPMALCGIAPSGTSANHAQVVVIDGYYEFTLGANEVLSCFWYHVPAGAGGSFTINTWLCPDGYDIHNVDITHRADCTEKREGVKFSISGPGGFYAEQLSGAVVAGGVQWKDLAAGDYTIEETVPDGIAKRFFLICEGDEDTALPLTVPSTTIPVTPGAQLVCHWYNVPDEDGGIYVHKFDCPEGADYREASLELLDETCVPTPGQIAFHLLDEEGGDSAKNTDAGVILWTGIKAGEYALREEIPDGSGQPIVFCDSAQSEADLAFERWPVNDGTVEFQHDGAGWYVICAFFNIPSNDGSVFLQKYFCPEEIAGEPIPAGPNDLTKECEPYEGDEVAFDLYHAGTGKTETRSPNEPKTGAAIWDPVPPGDLTITEHEMEGYGTPIVYCGPGRPEDVPDYARYDVEGMSVAVRLGSSVEMFCAWFNIPAEDGSVTVVKYDCPVGIGTGTGTGLVGFAWYDERCNEPAEGVSFKLDGERTGNPGSKETGADGMAIWGDREADRYFLTEDVPAGYGKPAVFCDSYYPLDEQPPAFAPVAVNGDARIEFGLSEGQAILCVWFNIPVSDYDDPGTLGRVTVVKYWCDGNVVSETTCGRYGGGQTFVLRPAGGGGGETIELTTGANGAKTVAAPAGRWELDEVGREWCKAASADTDQNGYLVVAEGRETVVTVYNCGDRPEPKPEPVTKLPNTGSGAASAPPVAGMTGGAATLGLLLAAGPLLALAIRRTRRVRKVAPRTVL